MNPLLPSLLGHLVVIGLMLAGLALAGWPPQRLAETAWWWPFWIAHLGLIAGTIVWRLLVDRADDAESTIAEGRRTDLLETRAIVIEQLRHLEVERDKLDPDDYATERSALLSVGAAASRALEETTPDPPSEPLDSEPAMPSPDDTPSSFSGQLQRLRDADPAAFDAALSEMGLRPAPQGLPDLWRGVIFTLVTVAVLGVVGWNVAGTARDRVEGMPMTGGDQVMASNERTEPPQGAPPDDGLTVLQRRAEANPNDLSAWNQLTEVALARQQMDVAMEANQKATALDPQDPDARTFAAVMQAFIGRADEALGSLADILEEHPDHLRALVYRGLLSMERDPAVAVESLERALAIEDNPMLRGALAEARAAAGGGSPPTATPQADVLAAGTLTLSEPVVPEGAVIFLSLRDPAGGPPLAARKLPSEPWPDRFTLTTADRLPMGGDRPVPDRVLLVARLDSDGDPLTRPDSDPSAQAEVARGGEEVTLVLKTGP